MVNSLKLFLRSPCTISVEFRSLAHGKKTHSFVRGFKIPVSVLPHVLIQQVLRI